MQPKDRIICALDVDSAERALNLVEKLHPYVGVFKVGLELINATGVRIVNELCEAGATKIFYDAKLHDIPNTVAGAMRGVAKLGAWCVTVHATGGKAMLAAAVDAARSAAGDSGFPPPKILAVTVLTSIGPEVLREELLVQKSLSDYVTHLAKLAFETGCDGVIASPQEIETIRAALPAKNFLIVTPGVRPVGAAVGDQSRVLTPIEAIRRGADYLVIGRPIVAEPDPVAAAQEIADQISL